MEKAKQEFFTRFSPRQRLEHFLVMVLFLLLAVTGFPQKFFDMGWAQWLIVHLGGIDRVRSLHRLAGILFAVIAALHLAVVLSLAMMKRVELNMIPTKKDFRDAIITLRYYLGVSEEQAQFDRYEYRQKFEYWGLILGGAIMILTGFILYFPIAWTSVLPGEVVPAANVAHSSEGLLAFLIVIIWHIYNAHLNPDVFPFDTSIFTGKISEERMEKEHPLEYARLIGGETEISFDGEGAENAGRKGKQEENIEEQEEIETPSRRSHRG
ncbi:MAG: cytochrome b/b6 domain-containing protein [Deltaproteobacteria bacterium]|nr:cytochrome b/b6 domain-containing protein [Deltaproteobacteria bacterium]